ncbi:cell division ATP-binding protein FtsE [Thermodesulforhabdus norvegica]|uniref:Cell division transport system ATP-binding protein n=1 Tax=Thermodesulforhabdus norvegica TaxID=39841 RepID=A0A1I4TYT0_9BACT|nr:ATP-binding cassette domain-containing protein [Thermodesulforhabdus norvegica]SFM81819.1 cell division transport system ATP-binding protein [Thermodesulforhabdus norvegica]
MKSQLLVSCRGLYKRYRSSEWVFEDAWVDVKQGDFLFLLGASGSGKTTFIQIVAGELPYDRGVVEVNGKDIKSYGSSGLYRWKRKIGIVFQDFRLLGDNTVFENIALPLILMGYSRPDIERRVNAAVRLLKLQGKEDVLCKTLSGGEQQRVAIARAIVHSPGMILADEPTGNLDDLHTSIIFDILKSLHSRGITVVIATHDKRLPLLISNARVIMIKKRRFVEVVPVLRKDMSGLASSE